MTTTSDGQLGGRRAVAERHSIIAHDWQNATMRLLVSRQLRRVNTILARAGLHDGRTGAPTWPPGVTRSGWCCQPLR